MNNIIIDDHYMLECVHCLQRVPIHVKDEKQIKFMYCANCNNTAVFAKTAWKDTEIYERIRKEN